MKVRKYTEEEFNRDCEIIANNIKKAPVKYEYIIALARGGVPIGSRLSHLTGIPVIEVSYSLKDWQRGINMTAKIEEYKLWGKTLLIVDDISDSGKTLEEVAGFFDGQVFHTATLVFKPQTSHYRPTYLATLHMGDEWVEFFWEEPLIAK